MKINELANLIKPYILGWTPRWVYPYSAGWVGTAGAPLTSASWDGDAYSTTEKTLIDLSTVFGVPAGVKAVLVLALVRDSGSAASAVVGIRLSPNNVAGSYPFAAFCSGVLNDAYIAGEGEVSCDANGDIYYQTTASGAGTLDVQLQIWGYLI